MSSLMDKMKMVDPMNALAPMRSDKDGNFGDNRDKKDDREKSVSEAVQEECEKRMTKAAEDLKKKYASGRGGDDMGENGPTGHAYSAAAVAERDRRRGIKEKERGAAEAEQAKDQAREREVRAQHRADNEESDEEDGGAAEEEEDSDDEFLNELESSEDPELARLRHLRLGQLRADSLVKQQMEREGYGALTEIVQDEFLPKVTAAARAVVHFYHNDFHRCKIMDKHLREIAFRHRGTLFLLINAEKAPFFAEKLNVRVLPTLICFFEGKTTPQQRQIGFIGLEPPPGKGEDEWPVTALEARLGEMGAIDYSAAATDSELRRYGLLEKSSISASRRVNTRDDDDDDYC